MKQIIRNGWVALSILLIAASCQQESVIPSRGNGGTNGNADWTIPVNEVRDGGPGKDGIPSIDAPQFISAAEATWLGDEELIVGIKIGNEVRAYPHQILDWHEIVNDEIGTDRFAILYCPLTGTATAWNRIAGGGETTFGVSGLLYNSNLIPYDRNTDSNWSQMRQDCVNGTLAGEKASTYQIIETSWRTWRALYPQTKVLSRETGFSRTYGNYPYGSFRTDHEYLIFPVSSLDERLLAKTRVLALADNDETLAFPLTRFSGSGQTVIQEKLGDAEIIAVGSQSSNFALAYYRNLPDGTLLEFSDSTEPLPALLEDQEGNIWDMFGVAISGPRQGQQLEAVQGYMGYWFAIGAFHRNIPIVE